MKRQAFFSLLILLAGFELLFAQNPTQTIRGNVKDKESGYPLPGVIVRVQDGAVSENAVTDVLGNFKLTGVPVGRRTFIFSFTGYKTGAARDVIVVSGKEAYLTIEMEEDPTQLEEVKVVAEEKGTFNEMNTVSAKLFSIEETERYPGSRNDPARMASNFAGVQRSEEHTSELQSH